MTLRALTDSRLTLAERVAMMTAEEQAAVRKALREHPDAPRPTHWIYAIQADGYGGDIKIGISRAPRDRLQALQTASPLDLRGIAAWRGFPWEEKMLHELYGYARIRGEWFRHHLPMYQYLRERGGRYRWNRR